MSSPARHSGRSSRGSFARPSPSSRGRDIFTGVENTPFSTLERPESNLDGYEIAIKQFAYIGSYNWLEAKQPTIVVPGSPRRWLDATLPVVVEADDGRNFIDQNGFRMGKWPLVPLIQAVQTMAGDNGRKRIDWPSVDFVTDRNGLRKLLRWVTQSSFATGKSNDFRIDAQLAGDGTVLLSRWEKVTRERGGNTGQSYGFNFEKAVTAAAPGCEQSTGHHRIITYDFDGLKLVIRFEVDAYLPHDSFIPSVSQSPPEIDPEGDELADKIRDLSMKPNAPPAKPQDNASTQLKIVLGGKEVPQSSLIEMKTRTAKSILQLRLAKEFPQLYFSQTPYHYVGMHENGKFTLVRKDEVGAGSLAHAEEDIQAGLKKLRALLASIQKLLKGCGSAGMLALICTEGLLKVYKGTGDHSCLPKELLELFSP